MSDWTKVKAVDRFGDAGFVAEFIRLWPHHATPVIRQRMGFVSDQAVRMYAWKLGKKIVLPAKSPQWIHSARVNAGRIGAAKRWKQERSVRFDYREEESELLVRANVPPATLYDATGRAFGTLDPMTRERRYFETAR